MKRIYPYLVLAGLLLSAVGYAQKTSLSLSPSFISTAPLYNTLQKHHATIDWDSNKPLHLFVFLSPDCPLCRNYAPLLNNLEAEYRDKVQVYGIVPGRSYADTLVTEFLQTFSIGFPVLKDNRQQLKKHFKASTTPEVFLLDEKGIVLYQGAIDNWAVALGKKRINVTEHYLLDAVRNGLNHIPVAIKYMQPVGCVINDY